MPLCQVCQSHGVMGEALPGSAFCAAHGAAHGAAHDGDVASEVGDTSLTQGAARLDIDDGGIEFDEVGAAGPAAPPTVSAAMQRVTTFDPPGLASATFSISDRLLLEWVEGDVLQHLDFVQASALAQPIAAQVAIQCPSIGIHLKSILTRLAYDS
ncbi:unnamed protein product [Prorocentrum cordatum]|uniref:Uncharacterized protein n=1 Tax=Prorocentrum cordatum TaxID=2364126 RepID=A0ABN9RMT2_9DINO|nr:unnamed protein product [Polarella glacialis]